MPKKKTGTRRTGPARRASVSEAGRQATGEKGKWVSAVLDSVLDGIITIDEQGTVLSFSTGATRIFAYTADEVLGKNVKLLMPEPYHSEHDGYLRNYLETGQAKVIGKSREVMGRRKDGSQFPVELAVTEISAQGTRKDFVGLIRDITERKRAEEKLGEMVLQLEKSRSDMRTILNQMRPGVVMIDGEGKIQFANRRCINLLEVDRESLIGSPWADSCPFSGEDKARLDRCLVGSWQSAEKVFLRLNSPSGKQYWIEIEMVEDPRDAKARILFIYDVSEVHNLRLQLEEKAHFGNLVGKSEPMRQVFSQIAEFSSVDATVLIDGETGTGKELVAQAIHTASARKDGPFIAVNCAGFTESLITSQLFGHKRGAFTGATTDHPGMFEEANGGTLFLDEIGDIPAVAQQNLLRVLQEREITRVGESRPRKVDVRLLSATNRDLQSEVEKNAFRSDLLYRIRVATIHLPPLRERRSDIPLLAHHFLGACQTMTGRSVQDIGTKAMSLLMAYDWPGNVRELQNIIEVSVIRCKGSVLQPRDIPPELHAAAEPTAQPDPEAVFKPGHSREELLAALKQARGNRAAAARLLGIGRTTLYRQLKRLGLSS